jgi:hypothetical protein
LILIVESRSPLVEVQAFELPQQQDSRFLPLAEIAVSGDFRFSFSSPKRFAAG